MFFVISLSTGRIFLRLQVGADQMVHLIEFSDGMLTLMKDQIIVSGNIQEQPDGPDNNEYCKVIQTEQTYKQTYNQVDPLKKLPGLFCLLTDPLYIRTGKAAPWDMDAMNHSFFVFS